MYSGLIECSIVCPKCDRPIILNGPLEFGHCNACQSDIPISHEFWKDIFADIITDIVTELEEGEGRNSTIFGEFHTRLKYGYLRPRCSNCKEPLDIKETNITKPYELKCSSCGDKATISPPPEWLKEIFPAALCFVNAFITSKKDESAPAFPEGVSFSCPRCGGMLIVDGKDRLVPCEYCKLQVYLPDDLWLRIHPVEQKKEWFIVYDDKEAEKIREGETETNGNPSTEEEEVQKGRKFDVGSWKLWLIIAAVIIVGLLIWFFQSL